MFRLKSITSSSSTSEGICFKPIRSNLSILNSNGKNSEVALEVRDIYISMSDEDKANFVHDLTDKVIPFHQIKLSQ